MGNNCFKLPLQATTAQQGCDMEDYCKTFVHRDHLVHSFLLEIHCTTSSFQERVILISKNKLAKAFRAPGFALFTFARMLPKILICLAFCVALCYGQFGCTQFLSPTEGDAYLSGQVLNITLELYAQANSYGTR